MIANRQILPLLVLRGMVVFPNTMLNFDVGRDMSEKALEASEQNDGLLFLSAQRNINDDDPDITEIYTMGTICRVKQKMRLPGGHTRVLVEGISRPKLRRHTQGSSNQALKSISATAQK